MMDLKPLDLVWVEGQSTSWSHPCELAEFSDIPGLEIISDSHPPKKRPLLSQVYLPSHRLPPSEFDPPPTLALYTQNPEAIQDKIIALQLSLFPSAIYCHVPGGDKSWKAALQLEREVHNQRIFSKSVEHDSSASIRQNSIATRVDGTVRRTRSSSKPVICEFRRNAGLMPQLSRYLKPTGRNMVIRFVQEDDLERPDR